MLQNETKYLTAYSKHLSTRSQSFCLRPGEKVNRWSCANAVIVVLKSRLVFHSLHNIQRGLWTHTSFISTTSLFSVLDCAGWFSCVLNKRYWVISDCHHSKTGNWRNYFGPCHKWEGNSEMSVTWSQLGIRLAVIKFSTYNWLRMMS